MRPMLGHATVSGCRIGPPSFDPLLNAPEHPRTKGTNMRMISVTNSISLDGVMQAPMSADEDTRDGFTHGGWALGANNDPELAAEMAKGMAGTGAMLFGHRTYDHMFSFWPHQTDGNPYTE